MNNTKDTNQASEDEPINQHLVCLWQLQDIEETIADAAPEELVALHSKLVALSTDITEAVQSAIRTGKLKLLAEVRERVVGENINWNHSERMQYSTRYTDSLNYMFAVNSTKDEQRAELDKLEAEL